MYSVGEVRNRLFNSTGRKLRLFIVDSGSDRFSSDEPPTEPPAVSRKPARAKAQPAVAQPKSAGGDPAVLALRALVSDPVPASAIAAAEQLGLSAEKLAILGGVPLVKVQELKAGAADDEAWQGLHKKAKQWLAMLGQG